MNFKEYTTRKAILGLAILYAALALAAFAVLAWRELERIHEETLHDAGQVAEMLDEQLSRIVRATDAALRHMRDHYEVSLRAGQPLGDSAITHLREAAAGLPTEASLWFADAEGRLYEGIRPGQIRIADRDYFQRHRDGLQFGVGTAIKGRVTSKHQWIISRRVEGPDNAFAGILFAAIDVNDIGTLFNAANLGPHASITLLREDGGLVLRYPMQDEFLDRSPFAESRLPADMTAKISGVTHSVSNIDGIDRWRTWRRLQGLPLYVMVGIAASHCRDIWLDRMLFAGSLALLVLLPVLVSLRFALGLATREECQRDQLEETVRERTARLQTALAARDRFFASASHDLRQPMQAIRLFTDVLRLDGSANHHKALTMLDASVRAGESLLSALLQVSRLDAGRVEPDQCPFDLDALLAEVVAHSRPLAEAKGLSLDLVPCGLWAVSDPGLLGQVLTSLVCNAVRYTERGRVLVGCRRRGGNVRIEVWDTGIGIPADKLDEVFEDFVQLGNRERDRAKGLGLGLAIVRRAAALLGHRVLVRSNPGRGSVFAVELPQAQPVLQAASAA